MIPERDRPSLIDEFDVPSSYFESSSESNSDSESVDGEEEEKKMREEAPNRKRSDKIFAKDHEHGEHCELERRRCSLDEMNVSSSICGV